MPRQRCPFCQNHPRLEVERRQRNEIEALKRNRDAAEARAQQSEQEAGRALALLIEHQEMWAGKLTGTQERALHDRRRAYLAARSAALAPQGSAAPRETGT